MLRPMLATSILTGVASSLWSWMMRLELKMGMGMGYRRNIDRVPLATAIVMICGQFDRSRWIAKPLSS